MNSEIITDDDLAKIKMLINWVLSVANSIKLLLWLYFLNIFANVDI